MYACNLVNQNARIFCFQDVAYCVTKRAVRDMETLFVILPKLLPTVDILLSSIFPCARFVASSLFSTPLSRGPTLVSSFSHLTRFPRQYWNRQASHLELYIIDIFQSVALKSHLSLYFYKVYYQFFLIDLQVYNSISFRKNSSRVIA